MLYIDFGALVYVWVYGFAQAQCFYTKNHLANHI